MIFQFTNDIGKEDVKVLYLADLKKHVTSQFGGDQSLNKILDLIQPSNLTYKEEILSCLNDKVNPIQTYITCDNYVFIGYCNIISYLNMSSTHFNDCKWKHYITPYARSKNNTPQYVSYEHFGEDICYFFINESQMLARHHELQKSLFTIKKDVVSVKTIQICDEDKFSKVYEVMTFKGHPYMIGEQTNEFGERVLRCTKYDINSKKSRILFSIKLLYPDYKLILNRSKTQLAIIYKECLVLHSVLHFKNEPLISIDFDGQLDDVNLEEINAYQISDKYIYFLAGDTLYIVNIEE